mmetsp:Transcript_17743/g.22367  ORF Transcript_17743/g.22367 Transcript_17743/m.22367 type:complete len:143 (+) Transcript_17743:63-491(+)
MNTLSLLKKVKPERVCPRCEVVQTNLAQHCSACDRCVVDFDGHSLLVNNCISANNRPYLIIALVSLIFFLAMQLIIAIFHFERPARAIDNFLEDIASVEGPKAPTDLDWPYTALVVAIFGVSLSTIVPLILMLRRQCVLFGE